MKDDTKFRWIAIGCGYFVVIWVSVLFAPALSYSLDGGIPAMLPKFWEAFSHPFSFVYCGETLPCVLVLSAIYGLVLLIYHYTKPNYRRREEHGSAQWGSIKETVKKYSQKPESMNKILTQHMEIGYDAHKHRRNMNTLVIGGSGAGKTRFYAKPNILQCNTSFVILDPKGEILRDTGNVLKQNGYDVRVLDLINMEKSFSYNPILYAETDNDVQRLVTNLFKATTPKGSQTKDPFWDTAGSMLLMALIFFIKCRAIPDEQNFTTIMELLRCGDVDEDSNEASILDEEFEELETIDPGNIALKYYRNYRSGASKTLKSIQITLAARLEKFNLSSLAKMTMMDELDLKTLGTKKVALFALIPDNDMSFNFLVSILYTQLFQQLFWTADHEHGGVLPIHVHFMMDEFANSVTRSQLKRLSVKLKNSFRIEGSRKATVS